jgi:hypothetical protein
MRIENSLFLMVNDRLGFCPPLKAFGRKGETGKRGKAAKKPGGRPVKNRQETIRKPACHLYE